MSTLKVCCEGEKIWVNIDGEDIDDLFDPISFIMPLTIELRTGVMNLELFTCSCGVGGCAGWHEGFDVSVNGDYVSWICLDPGNSAQIPDYLEFPFDEYIAAQIACTDMLYDIAMTRSVTPEPYEYAYSWGILNFANPEELTDKIKRSIEWLRR